LKTIGNINCGELCDTQIYEGGLIALRFINLTDIDIYWSLGYDLDWHAKNKPEVIEWLWDNLK
jgi:hypothetical protein